MSQRGTPRHRERRYPHGYHRRQRRYRYAPDRETLTQYRTQFQEPPLCEEEIEEAGKPEIRAHIDDGVPHVSDYGAGFILGLFALSVLGGLLCVLGLSSIGNPTPTTVSLIGAGAFLIALAAIGAANKAKEIRMRRADEAAERSLHSETENLERTTKSSGMEANEADSGRSDLRRLIREVWLEPRNEAEAGVLRPVWGNCRQCGTLIIVSDSSYCSNCGANLSAGTGVGLKPALRPEVKPVPRQMKSDSVAGNCIVCNLRISPGETLAWCPHCGNAAHRVHMLEWLHVNRKCPLCGERLDERELVAQIGQKFSKKREARKENRQSKS